MWMLILLVMTGTPAADNPPKATILSDGMTWSHCQTARHRFARDTRTPVASLTCVKPVRK